MTTEHLCPKNPEIPEQVEEISFPGLVEAYTNSCEFKRLSPITQKLYKNSLEAISRRIQASEIDYSEICTRMFTDSFGDEKVSNYTKSAFKNAVLWGNFNGLTNTDLPTSRNSRYSQPTHTFTPLTPDQLTSLIDIANPKYRAIILLSVATKARAESVLSLSKENFQKGQDAKLSVDIEDKKITIPSEFEEAILTHIQNAPGNLLFESPEHEREPLTRAAVYGVYKTYAKKIPGLNHLGHSDLVMTGKQLFGNN